MALLTAQDLKFDYSWHAVPPDDPKATGAPDDVLLNREEGYEVLAFINRVAAVSKWTDKLLGLKAERLIKQVLPGSVRSRLHVWQWLVDNWNKF